MEEIIMTTCTCWADYPNTAHKKSTGKWKCVDCYKNISNHDGYKRKTRCVKTSGEETKT